MNCKERLTVIYTNNDDGIWVECFHMEGGIVGGCKWTKHLDFSPSVDDILKAQEEHDNRPV